jgi:hypothetical protein
MTRLASSEEFVAALAQQDAELAFALPPTDRMHTRLGSWSEWPSSVIDVMDVGGVHLRKKPQESLIQPPSPIDVARLPQDHVSQAVGAMINASVVPPDERIARDVPSFGSVNMGPAACAMAEPGFVDAFRAMRQGKIGPDFAKGTSRKDAGAMLVVDANGSPVLLQIGSGGVESALTLEEVDINGVPHPAGSLVGIGFFDPAYEGMAPGLHIVGSHEVSGLGFRRITGFALPAEQRMRYDSSYEFSAVKKLILKHLSIERMRRATVRTARIAMAQSGVVNPVR